MFVIFEWETTSLFFHYNFKNQRKIMFVSARQIIYANYFWTSLLNNNCIINKQISHLVLEGTMKFGRIYIYNYYLNCLIIT